MNEKQKQPASSGKSPSIVLSGNERMDNLRTLLAKTKGRFAQVLPKHVTVERMTRLVLAAASRTPRLLDCTPESILQSALTAAALGLEPSTPLQLSYLVPHKNGALTRKYGRDVYEAQFIIGYRGLIALAIQSGDVQLLQARLVREGDEFEFEFGLEERLYHKPLMTNEPGPIVAAYAIAKMSNGAKVFDIMSLGEIEYIRSKSKSADTGPWVDNFGEMAKKTVLRRLGKVMPMSIDKAGGFQRALEVQAKNEAGESAYVEPESDDAPIVTPKALGSRTESLAERLAAQQPKAEEVVDAFGTDEQKKTQREPGED